MVVHLTIEDDCVLPARRPHGLMAGRREIHDRQPAVPQRHQAPADRDPRYSRVIRSSMPDEIQCGLTKRPVYCAQNSTHLRCALNRVTTAKTKLMSREVFRLELMK